MNSYFQALLAAAKEGKHPTPALRRAIRNIERHLSDRRRRRILKLGRATLAREGEQEFDDDAIVSEGNDNGAYLQCWVWVDFGGTELDKEPSVRARRSKTSQRKP